MIFKNNIVSEPSEEWGGTWTERKLTAFSKYVSAYLTIMKKHPQWKTIYFDGFAGSGNRKSDTVSAVYEQLRLTPQEERIYKGAAERVLSLERGLSFDYYYFIDTDAESLKKLETKLAGLQKSKENPFQFRSGDCNMWILELSKALHEKKNKFTSLVLLDPFGMQIDWNSISSLKDTRTDIWILIPTGVVVNRLLDKSCKLKHINKLQSFFGLDENAITDVFYKKEMTHTLFGEAQVIQKVTKPIEKIANLYAQQLNTIWPYVVEKPLRLENSRGVPIFHFVFASNNKYAVKIAKQIIESV